MKPTTRRHPGASRQQGLSLLGWLVAIAVLVVFGALTIRVVPAWIEYSTVRTVIGNYLADAQVGMLSEAEVRTDLERRLQVNNVTAVDGRDLLIDVQGGRVTVGLDYEVREPLFANLDIVIRFQKDFDTSLR